jgi:hypothetical protein
MMNSTRQRLGSVNKYIRSCGDMGVVEETQVMENRTFLPTTTIKGSRVVNVKEEHLGKMKK